jgi:hypothetical protein
MMLFHLLLISEAGYAIFHIYLFIIFVRYDVQASDGLYDDLPEGTYDNRALGGIGRHSEMTYDNPQGLKGNRAPMVGTEGGVYDNPNALEQAQEGGLYDNPKVLPLFVSL